MIIHKLIARGLAHGDDETFYLLQAQDAVRWLQQQGVEFGPGTTALDLGCGHGIFGAELLKLGCQVTFADEGNYLWSQIPAPRFIAINIDADDLSTLGSYDLVICSNVYEHLAKPDRFIAAAGQLLTATGKLYLSWTNWLSPWGGHEFSPFHYLGALRGHLIYDRLVKKPRRHTPFVNLYPTSIGRTLKRIRQQPDLRILRAAPRYYPEFGFLLRLPIAREFLTWNCALLIGKE